MLYLPHPLSAGICTLPPISIFPLYLSSKLLTTSLTLLYFSPSPKSQYNNNRPSQEYDPFGGSGDPFGGSQAQGAGGNVGWSNPSYTQPGGYNAVNMNRAPSAVDAPWNGGAAPPADVNINRTATPPVPGVGLSGPGVPDFSHEPPLLQELGINFDHIYKKTLIVLIPTKRPLTDVLDDADMAGPLVFCFLLGCALLLVRKSLFHIRLTPPFSLICNTFKYL
jgi:hypothetical protein